MRKKRKEDVAGIAAGTAVNSRNGLLRGPARIAGRSVAGRADGFEDDGLGRWEG
jgi:hypothetical protein